MNFADFPKTARVCNLPVHSPDRAAVWILFPPNPWRDLPPKASGLLMRHALTQQTVAWLECWEGPVNRDVGIAGLQTGSELYIIFVHARVGITIYGAEYDFK